LLLTGGGPFNTNREVNMNGLNLYFNSAKNGKLFMGNPSHQEDCMELHTRLEISASDLPIINDYVTPDPSPSGLRFTDLTSNDTPIDNQTEGVLSLDQDGDVIWVKTCCSQRPAKDEQLANILERLTKIENELRSSKEQASLLKEQIKQMDVVLGNNNLIVLNQNVPNPFAESTVITYNIPAFFRHAQIVFSTITGEIIRTLEIKTAGKGQINVYADNISAGMYTYSLIIDGKRIDTKKMIRQ
jgi:hypothetical protein